MQDRQLSPLLLARTTDELRRLQGPTDREYRPFLRVAPELYGYVARGRRRGTIMGGVFAKRWLTRLLPGRRGTRYGWGGFMPAVDAMRRWATDVLIPWP